MVNSIFTLRQLAAEWTDALSGAAITDAWSQHRGELILAVDGGGQLHLRLSPPVQCVFRSLHAARARRNAAMVLDGVRGARIRNVRIAPGDRILMVSTDGPCELQAFLFGARANAFLVAADGWVTGAFRNQTDWVGRAAPVPVAASLPDSLDAFMARWQGATQGVARVLGRVLRVFDRTLVQEVLHCASVDDKPATTCGLHELESMYAAAQSVARALTTPQPRIYLASNIFSLIPLEHCSHQEVQTYASADEAVRAWAKRALSKHALASQRDPLLKVVVRASAKARRTARNLRRESLSSERAAKYEHYAHLLMASPVQPAGRSSTQVPDLMGNHDPLTIPLKASLSSIENAERYYAKARKARAARNAMVSRAEEAEQRAQRLQALEGKLRSATSLAVLKAVREREAVLLSSLRSQRQPTLRCPFLVYPMPSRFEVRVGKSARDSDALTLRHARPFDLWLHARGASGAHVVLRLPHKTAQPSAVLISTAAAIAAYHSKARGSALVPVIVTPRKFVRKPKGLMPGAVIVDREEVLIVKPALPAGHA